MRIRPASQQDLPAVRDILNGEIAGSTASWKSAPLSDDAIRAWYDELLGAALPLLVADPGAGAIVGYASFGPFRAGEGYAHTVEHSVYVAAAARRRGVATALLGALIAEGRARGLSRMVGGISADQPGSLALHRALGFADCGRLPGVGRKFGRSLDLVLMVLVLD